MNRQANSTQYIEFVQSPGPEISQISNNAFNAEDVLICGKCNYQCSNIKAFMVHKDVCKGNLNTSINSQEGITISTSQAPVIASDQLSLQTPQNSLVNFTVGMPHVIFQTVPQDCRIVLESNVSPTNHANQEPEEPEQNNIASFVEHYTTENKKTIKEKEPFCIEHINVDTDCPENKVTIAKPSIIPQSSVTNTEEEDVATFLATQMAAQKVAEELNEAQHNQPASAIESFCSADKIIMELGDQHTINNDMKQRKPISSQQTINGDDCNARLTKPRFRRKITYEEDLDFVKICAVVDGKLFCSYEGCFFETKHKKNIIRHYMKHTGIKPFACSICPAKFSRQDKLRLHERIHNDDRPYQCQEPGCTYRGIEKTSLIKHHRTHTNDRPYHCQICPYQAKDYSQLIVHLRSHTGDRPFHCQRENCSAAFTTSSDLKRHERVHSGVKPHKCTECNYAATLKHNLSMHVKLNHFVSGPKYSCAVCSSVANTRKQWKEHEKTHSKGGNSSSHNGNHRGPTKSKRGYYKFGPFQNYKCAECDCGFVREDSYRSHMRQHTKRNDLTMKNVLEGHSRSETICEPLIKLVLQGNSFVPPEEPEQPDLLTASPSHLSNKHSTSDVLPALSTGSTGALNSYVITIDGVSTVYPNLSQKPSGVLNQFSF